MKNITIKEIAKESGVSIGTVSNVLNNKKNIKVETIRKVENAIKKLGYIKNTDALSIKKKSSIYIGFVIDEINSTISNIITDLMSVLSTTEYELKLIEASKFSTTTDLINKIDSSNLNTVIFTHKTKTFSSYLNSNIKRIVIGSKGHHTDSSIQFNLNKIKELLNSNAIIYKGTDNLSFSDMLCENGDYNVIDDLNDIFRFSSSPLSFIVFDIGCIDEIIDFCIINDIEIYKIYLISSQPTTCQISSLVELYYFSSNELAIKILYLIRKINNNINGIIESININKLEVQNSYQISGTLNLLMLENPFSRKFKELIPLFTKSTGINVSIDLKSFDEVERICQSERIYNYDVARLDMNSFQFYGKSIFHCLNNNEIVQKLANSFSDWSSYIYIDHNIYALPVDTSVQILLYRKDIFDNAIIKKMIFDKLNIKSMDNISYKDFINIADIYNKLDIPEKNINFFTSLSFNNPLLVASEFLPYFLSNNGKVILEDNLIKLKKSAFINTMKLYRKLLKNSFISKGVWWDEEVRLFNQSETATIVAYTSQLSSISIPNIGFSYIPGTHPSMGGGCIGIIKNSNNMDAAIALFNWLYQYKTQLHFAKSGICIPFSNMYYDKTVYTKYPFLSFSNNSLPLSKRIHNIGNDVKVNTILFEEIVGKNIIDGINKTLTDENILSNIEFELNNSENIIKHT